MDKKGFEKRFRLYLLLIPASEREEAVNYYLEIINDKIDSGLTEEQAIDELGSIFELAKGVMKEGSPSKGLPKKNRKWLVILLSSTAIVWVPVAIVLLSAVFAIAVILAATGFSFAVATCAILIYMIPNLIIGIVTGMGVWTIIFSTGFILFCSGVLGLMAAGIYQISKYCMKSIKFMFRRKNKKGATV